VAAVGSKQAAVESKQGSLHGNFGCVTVTGKLGLPELALLLSARSPVSPTTFLTTQKMASNAKCACFVAMALGHARQAAGEILTSKSGLPELAPLLSTRSPVSPVASLHQWQSVIGRVTATV